MLTRLKVDWYGSIEVLIWLLIHMILQKLKALNASEVRHKKCSPV